MRRFPWDILLTLLVGIGLGLAYAWAISPWRVFDSDPAALRADFGRLLAAGIIEITLESGLGISRGEDRGRKRKRADDRSDSCDVFHADAPCWMM